MQTRSPQRVPELSQPLMASVGSGIPIQPTLRGVRIICISFRSASARGRRGAREEGEARILVPETTTSGTRIRRARTSDSPRRAPCRPPSCPAACGGARISGVACEGNGMIGFGASPGASETSPAAPAPPAAGEPPGRRARTKRAARLPRSVREPSPWGPGNPDRPSLRYLFLRFLPRRGATRPRPRRGCGLPRPHAWRARRPLHHLRHVGLLTFGGAYPAIPFLHRGAVSNAPSTNPASTPSSSASPPPSSASSSPQASPRHRRHPRRPHPPHRAQRPRGAHHPARAHPHRDPRRRSDGGGVARPRVRSGSGEPGGGRVASARPPGGSRLAPGWLPGGVQVAPGWLPGGFQPGPARVGP